MRILLDGRFILLIGLPIWMIFKGRIIYNKKKENIKINILEEVLDNLFVIYLFMLTSITIFPIYIGNDSLINVLSFTQRLSIEVIPFSGYNNAYYRLVVRNIVGNIILLAPFIAYLCAKYPKLRNIKSCLKTAFFISLAIESTQLFLNIVGLVISPRVVSIEDLILNTLGGILGLLVFKLFYRWKIKDTLDLINNKEILNEVIK